MAIMQEEVSAINAVLESIKPVVQMHGGSIELDRIENDVVYVKMRGACIECPMSLYTLKIGVEQAIKDKLPFIREVVSLDD